MPTFITNPGAPGLASETWVHGVPQLRVPHPFQPHRKGWGIALSATALLVCVSTLSARAESYPCALTAIRSSGTLVYPKPASDAHIHGEVVVSATFSPDGRPVQVESKIRSKWLVPSASTYVNSWRVNETPARQTCPLSFQFTAEDGGKCLESESAVTMTDLQHFTVNRPFPCVYSDATTHDPAYKIHRLLFLHWNTQIKEHKA